MRGDVMAKPFAKRFYSSKAWKDCRASYISSVNHLCERCIADNKMVTGYIVHHKIVLTPFNIDDPNVTLNHEHLEYLCKRCHDEEHGVGAEGKVVRDGLKFNEYGELVEDEGE